MVRVLLCAGISGNKNRQVTGVGNEEWTGRKRSAPLRRKLILEQRGKAMNHQQQGTITVERGAKTYKATYRIEKGMITVSSGHGSKTTQLGSSPPETLARMILGEMINEGKA